MGLFQMGLQDLERTNITYGDHDSQSIRWHHHHQANNNAAFATQHFVDPTITRPFFEPGLIQVYIYIHNSSNVHTYIIHKRNFIAKCLA